MGRIIAIDVTTAICKGNCSVCKGYGGQCTHTRPLKDYLMGYVQRIELLWYKIVGMKYYAPDLKTKHYFRY